MGRLRKLVVAVDPSDSHDYSALALKMHERLASLVAPMTWRLDTQESDIELTDWMRPLLLPADRLSVFEVKVKR